MRVKSLAQEHNVMPYGSGLEAELLDPKSRALAIRPPRLPQVRPG